MQEWKDSGVQYYTNTRTKQQMPLRYQLYEDYINNREKLDIENAIKSLDIPILLCHGTLDNSVSLENAFKLQTWQPSAQLFTVQSDHVLGGAIHGQLMIYHLPWKVCSMLACNF